MKNWTESKEERRARKAKESAERALDVTVPKNNKKRYVVCLKWGDKYSADYVNVLARMVKRNLTLDYEFVCFTENPQGLDSDIRIEPLTVTTEITGWWHKPMFFNPNIGLNGTILFFDLDVVIFRNIDNLFLHRPGEFLIIRDFNRHVINNYQKFNSSVFRLETGNHSNVYTDFIKQPSSIVRKYHGDQDWIRASITNSYAFWPDEWIQSYKWEMRGKPRMDRGVRGQRDFITPGHPTLLTNTSVAVFHGDPNPHICKDPWVVDNWR